VVELLDLELMGWEAVEGARKLDKEKNRLHGRETHGWSGPQLMS